MFLRAAMTMVAFTRKRVAAGSFSFLLSTSVISCLSTPPKLQRRNIPCPPGLEYFDFQKEAIHTLVHRDIGLLLCDSMGLGKSISTIGALNLLENYEKVLIIAPKSLIPMWETELEKWLIQHGRREEDCWRRDGSGWDSTRMQHYTHEL